MRVPAAAHAGDLAHLSGKPRHYTNRGAFAGLSLRPLDTLARSASGPAIADPRVEELALAKFNRDAERLRKETRGRVRGYGER